MGDFSAWARQADPTEAEVKVEVKTEPRWAKKGTNQIQSGAGTAGGSRSVPRFHR